MSKLIQASQWLKEKVGKSKGSYDNEFDILYNRQEQIKDKTALTIKHFQQLVENFHAFSTTLQFVVDDLSQVFDDGDKFKTSVEKLQAVTTSIEKECVLPFQAQLNGPSCIGKLQEYLVSFDQVKILKKSRDGKLLEFDYHKEQVGSLSEKTQKDPLKLPKAKEKLEHAKNDYESVNDQAKQVMINLIDAKVDFDPVYLIFVSQVAAYQKGVSELLMEVAKDAKGATGGLSNNTSSFMKSQNSTTVMNKNMRTPMPEPEPESLDTFLDDKMDKLSMKPIELKKPPPRSQSVVDVIPPKINFEWFYLDKAMAQMGPVSASGLKSMFKRGEINSDAYVFGGDMSDWAKVSSLTDLNNYLKK